jgi:hypothetical protein
MTAIAVASGGLSNAIRSFDGSDNDIYSFKQLLLTHPLEINQRDVSAFKIEGYQDQRAE